MALTTMMKDSEIGDTWIQQMCAANPPQFVRDAAGNPTTNITTGPVRLAFCDSLFHAKPKMKTPQAGQESALAHSCVMLFPQIVPMTLFDQEWNRVAAEAFANCWNGAMWMGLDPAYRDQGEKANYSGFTIGSKFISTSSKFKPTIVDARFNPIVDEKAIYAGCWAIVCVNTYASGIGTPRKGPRFGLQSVMKIADDKSLEGAALDARAAFNGAKITPPSAPLSQQFGQQPVNAPGQAFGQAAIGQIYGGMPQAPMQQQYAPPQAPMQQYAPQQYAVQSPEITDPSMRMMLGLSPL